MRSRLRMMQVTRIEADGRHRRVWINDAPAFRLYPSETAQYGLREGEEITQETMERICRETLVRRARLRSLHILERMDRTAAQLREKLRREEYPPSVIEETITYLESCHYLDDLRYAASYLDRKGRVKSLSVLRMELRAAGLEDETIARAVEEWEMPQPGEVIERWMRKKGYDPDNSSREQTERFCRFLQRKGFSWEEIRKVLPVSS